MVLRPEKNQHGLKLRKFVAAEQEFNTCQFGIKGNIDATIFVEDSDKNEKLTALEIKTGKNKNMQYRGQVILYSLLIAERFKNSNPDNILLYIMDDDVKQGFDVIKQHKLELDALIIGRNELAKWSKKNTKNVFATKTEDIDSIRVVHLPPMLKNVTVCKTCFS
jgi:hypothetical protein